MENELSGACGTIGREERCVGSLVRNLSGRENFKHLGIDKKITLKQV
jgi:hypothetical protein